MLLNFDVERPMSAAALNLAMNADQILFLTAQKEISKDVPFLDDIQGRDGVPGAAAPASARFQDRTHNGGGPGAADWTR